MSEIAQPTAIQPTRIYDGTPLWVRIWHILVALLFLALVYSGVALTFSQSDFTLMNYDFASTLHEVTGVAISILYFAFVIYALLSGYWRTYDRRARSVWEGMTRPLARMLGADTGESQHRNDGEQRFKASTQFLLRFQQFLYLIALVVLMPLLIGTGLAYLYPETAPETAFGYAGLWPLALGHYVVGLLGALFLLCHVYISTIAGFRRIIFGR